MSSASWPSATRAAASVLSCRQLPQNMPPAPALMYAIRMDSVYRLCVRLAQDFVAAEDLRLFFHFGVRGGEQEGCQERDQVDRAADHAGGRGDLHRRRQTRKRL